MTKVFISYRRMDPDATLAKKIHEFLTALGLDVFIDTESIKWGQRWGQKIASNIADSEYFIVLLSKFSIRSEMVLEEIKQAKQTQEKNPNFLILPIRVQLSMKASLTHDLDNYLNSFQQEVWNKPSDTDDILKNLTEIIIERKAPKIINEDIKPKSEEKDIKLDLNEPIPSAPLVQPGGGFTINNPYYIERANEDRFIKEISNSGAVLKIRGPRQFGKTSLLSRITDFAHKSNFAVVALSFQIFGKKDFEDLDILLKKICILTTNELKIKNRLPEHWNNEDYELLPPQYKCQEYFEKYIFPEINDKPLVFAIDEADKLFDNQDVSDDFFSMLRAWTEEKATNPIWERFRLIITYSTDASLAIRSYNQSPFNIGKERTVVEFEKEEVEHFAKLHNLSFTSDEFDLLMDEIGGHPYLTHRTFYEIANGNYTLDTLLEEALCVNGPFGDHLRRHVSLISANNEAVMLILKIINKELLTLKELNSVTLNKLEASGLVLKKSNKVSIRYKLYEDYFKQNLMD